MSAIALRTAQLFRESGRKSARCSIRRNGQDVRCHASGSERRKDGAQGSRRHGTMALAQQRTFPAPAVAQHPTFRVAAGLMAAAAIAAIAIGLAIAFLLGAAHAPSASVGSQAWL